MPGRFLGPVQWRFQGDVQICQSLMPQARSIAGWLFNQIDTRATEVSHRVGKQRFVLSDTVAADCYVVALAGASSRQAIVYINAFDRSSETRGATSGIIVPPTTEFTELVQHGWSSKTYVFVTPEIESYYSGGGSDLPSGVSGRYIVGQIAADGPECSPGVVSTTFSDTPPEITGDSSHAALYGVYGDPDNGVYVETDFRYTYTATGFLRHFAQAINGKGNTKDIRSFITLLGTPFPSPTLYSYGLTIHEHDGKWTFWLTQITNGELRLVELYVGASGECIAQWLINEESSITDQDRELLFSYLLAGLKPKTGGSEVLSLDLPAAIADAVTSGWNPIAHSWHWDGFLGEDIERSSQAAVVLKKEDIIEDSGYEVGCYISAVARIEIQWDEDPESDTFGLPVSVSGTLSDQASFRIEPSGYHAAYSRSVGEIYWSAWGSGDTDHPSWWTLFTQTAVIYCRWLKNGSLDLIRYSPLGRDINPLSAADFGTLEPNGCGLYAANEVRYKRNGGDTAEIVSGGFSTISSSARWTGTFQRIRRAWNLGGDLPDWSFVAGYSSKSSWLSAINYFATRVSACDTNAYAWANSWNTNAGLIYYAYYVKAKHVEWCHESTEVHYNSKFRQIVLFPHDPTAVYSVMYEKTQHVNSIVAEPPCPASNGAVYSFCAGVVRDKVGGGVETVYGTPSEIRMTWGANSGSWVGVRAACSTATLVITDTYNTEHTGVNVRFGDDESYEEYSGNPFTAFDYEHYSYQTAILTTTSSANGVRVYAPYPNADSADLVGPDGIIGGMESRPDIGWSGGV